MSFFLVKQVLSPETIWKGNDGRDTEAKLAFEAVFHVSSSTDKDICTKKFCNAIYYYII